MNMDGRTTRKQCYGCNERKKKSIKGKIQEVAYFDAMFILLLPFDKTASMVLCFTFYKQNTVNGTSWALI